MSNKMLIDAAHPEETRVVVLRGNRVEDFDFESASKKPLRGNIYLAKVTRVEPSLQAAFIEYGGNRHGFLAFSEIHPDYYQIPVADRQALLEEEARAHREEDEESRPHNNQRRSRRHRRNGSSEKRATQDGEAVSGPADASGEDVDRDSALGNGFEAEEIISDREILADGDEAVSSASAGAEPLLPFAASAEADEVLTEEEVEPAFAEAPVEAATEEPAAAQTDVEVPDFESPSELASEGETGFAAQASAKTEAEVPAAGEPVFDLSAEGQPPVEHAGGGQAIEAFAGKDESEDDAEAEEEVVEQIGGDALEDVPYRAPRLRRHYKIQEVIKRRQILLVQVVKEERGNKGAALTTYLSLAGRYSVLMPNTARGGGISRKITDSEDRKRLKSIAHELEVPEGMGIILRTAGASRSESEVKRDFEYLLRMWETIRELTLRSTAPTLVYEEGSLIKRAIRDLYSKEMDEVCVAGEAAYREARDFMRLLMPSHIKQVRLYGDTQPIFAKSGVEAQLDAMFSNHVTLRSGGYIVINQTEALVAIDVNSGRSTREHNIEDTALRTNLEAADEVARQLRLRDLAGLIVVDFIDMEESRNNRAVERRMKDALKNDRARIQIGRISHFGLLEMSRQRIRTGVLEGSTVLCPHCAGAGTVRSTSSIALHVLRVLEDTLIRSSDFNLIVRTRMEVALYILNQKRAHLSDLEQRFGVMVTVLSDPALTGTVYHALERGDTATPPPRIASYVSPADSLVAEGEEFETEIDSEEDDLEAQESAELQAASDDRGAESDEAGGERRRRRRRRRRGRDRDERSPASVVDGEEVSADSVDEVGSPISADANEDSGEVPVGAELARDLTETTEEGEVAVHSDRSEPAEAPASQSQPEVSHVETDPAPTEEPRRRRSRRSAARVTAATGEDGSATTDTAEEGSTAPRRSRRSRSRTVEEESPTLLPFAGSETQAAPETLASASSIAAPATMPADQPEAETSGSPEQPGARAEPEADFRQDQPLTSAEAGGRTAEPSTVAPAAPEAPPTPERPKRSGWWQRAKATLTGE